MNITNQQTHFDRFIFCIKALFKIDGLVENKLIVSSEFNKTSNQYKLNIKKLRLNSTNIHILNIIFKCLILKK